MQILAPEEIRQWDLYTIEQEPISSLNLMERAASACIQWLESHQLLQHPFIIFCGKGNNGGDGLAIARMLSEKGVPVKCYIPELGHKGSDDFQANLARLHNSKVEISYIQSEAQLHPIQPGPIIIDAIFGSGLNRPPETLIAALIRHINQASNKVVAIDIPSGMFADRSSVNHEVISADLTLSFQCYKPAFLVPENEPYLGSLVILDIGLHPGYLNTIAPAHEFIEADFIKVIYRPRKAFAHKGSYGHALLIGGSHGKIGAIKLSSYACLRTGAGLLTSFIPGCGYQVMQASVPEAMVITSTNDHYVSETPPDLSGYNVIGIGPGLGVTAETAMAFQKLLVNYHQPMVIDADALNLISTNHGLLKSIPPFSILTPHPKEFERMFGKSENDFDRLSLAAKMAKELQVVIILKGHHSFIAMPGGKGYFNTTGNPGMATGGSGDVLTGILTGLLAQGYSAGEAALMGVFLHGLAGDHAAATKSQESMIASDIIEHLPEAFKEISA